MSSSSLRLVLPGIAVKDISVGFCGVVVHICSINQNVNQVIAAFCTFDVGEVLAMFLGDFTYSYSSRSIAHIQHAALLIDTPLIDRQ